MFDINTLPAPITDREALHQIRRKHKLSQEDVADALGMARGSLTNIETGKTAITLHMARTLALLFAHLERAEQPSAAPRGRPATAKPRWPANTTFAYTTVEPPHTRINGLTVEAMPAGARYRMITMRGSTLGSWNIMVRGEGTREDDMVAGNEPQMSDEAWLASTEKRLNEE